MVRKETKPGIKDMKGNRNKTWEDCMNNVYEVLANNLEINTEHAHRTGLKSGSKPRTIAVQFNSFNDKTRILRNCRKLEGTEISIYVMSWAIWYHLRNVNNVKSTHGGVLLLVKLQAKSNISPCVFFTFFKLYKLYKIEQRITYEGFSKETLAIRKELRKEVLYNRKQKKIFYFQYWTVIFNPLVPNAPFFYPLKTSETVRFSDVFRSYRKGALGTNGLQTEPKGGKHFYFHRSSSPEVFCKNGVLKISQSS